MTATSCPSLGSGVHLRFQELEGTRNIGDQGLPRSLGIPGSQRIDNASVLMRAIAHVDLVEGENRYARGGAGLQPKTLDDRQQDGGAAKPIDFKMEGLIQSEAFVPVLVAGLDLIQSLQRIFQESYTLFRHVGRGEGDSLSFDQNPRLEEIVDTLGRDRGHANRTVRQSLQSFLGHEAAEGLTHGHRACGQNLGKASNRQNLAGLEMPLDQRTPQLQVNPILYGRAPDWFQEPGALEIHDAPLPSDDPAERKSVTYHIDQIKRDHKYDCARPSNKKRDGRLGNGRRNRQNDLRVGGAAIDITVRLIRVKGDALARLDRISCSSNLECDDAIDDVSAFHGGVRYRVLNRELARREDGPQHFKLAVSAHQSVVRDAALWAHQTHPFAGAADPHRGWIRFGKEGCDRRAKHAAERAQRRQARLRHIALYLTDQCRGDADLGAQGSERQPVLHPKLFEPLAYHDANLPRPRNRKRYNQS